MNSNIVKMIKESRERANLSIRKLAKSTGISATHLSRIEKNTQNITPKILRKITRYIDLNYNDLMNDLGLGLNIGLNNPYIYEYYSNLKGDDLRFALDCFEKSIIEQQKLLDYLYKCQVKENDISDLLLDTIKDTEYIRSEQYHILCLLKNTALKEYRKGKE